MIITIDKPIEVTEDEISIFFYHKIASGLPFEQFKGYFESKDLDRVRELWKEAEEKLRWREEL